MARRHRLLAATVTALQQRYGPQALRRGTVMPRRERLLAVATGFAQLDARTGCGGIPLGHMTLLSGRATAGKLTLAYTLLAQAQAARQPVALLDLTRSADPDYLSRCGVDLMRLVVVRPELDARLLHLLLDLARSRQLRLLVVDSLHELAQTRAFRTEAGGLDLDLPASAVELPDLTSWEQTLWEYELLGYAPDGQVMVHLRKALRQAGVLATWQVKQMQAGRRVTVAGRVVRQRPETAKGMVFVSLEDESGLLDLVVRPDVYARVRVTLRDQPLVVVHGRGAARWVRRQCAGAFGHTAGTVVMRRRRMLWSSTFGRAFFSQRPRYTDTWHSRPC